MTPRPRLRWNNRFLGLGLLGLLLLGLLLAAPANTRLNHGSTWNRNPNGYSGWYEYMVAQGTPIQRWQRPVQDLLDQREPDPDQAPATLVLILPRPLPSGAIWQLDPALKSWQEAGQNLVVLGLQAAVTAAPFTSRLSQDSGPVMIQTRRRAPIAYNSPNRLLGDAWGGVVWQESPHVIAAITPDLAANAYLDQPGNRAFLSDLVTRTGGPIWVDEYLHGYRDADVVEAEVGGDTWAAYLARTPLAVLAAQLIGIGALALIAHNRRLGPLQPVEAEPPDNSQAYIQALGGVLHKAGSYDFVTQSLAAAERQALQHTLGLGSQAVADAILRQTWAEYSGQQPEKLDALLSPPPLHQDSQLQSWLQQLQSIQRLTQPRSSGHE